MFSLYGDCRGAIWSHRVQPSPAARQGANRQSRGVERAPIGSRAGLQMARITQAFRPLAHHLYPHEPLLQNGVWDRIFDPSQREQIVPMQITAVPPGFGHRQSASRRRRRVKQTVPKPSARRAAEGPPRFLWLPPMLARRYASRFLPVKPPRPSRAAACGARSERSRRPGIASWIAPTKTTKPGNWRWISALSPGFLPSATAWNRGNTTRPLTASAMKWNDCFADARASAASSLASTNSTPSFCPLSWVPQLRPDHRSLT